MRQIEPKREQGPLSSDSAAGVERFRRFFAATANVGTSTAGGFVRYAPLLEVDSCFAAL